MTEEDSRPGQRNVTREMITDHAPIVTSTSGADMPLAPGLAAPVAGGLIESIPAAWWQLLEPHQGLRSYLLDRLRQVQALSVHRADALDWVEIYAFVLRAIDDKRAPRAKSLVLPDGILAGAAIRFDCSERTIRRAVFWCEDELAKMSVVFS